MDRGGGDHEAVPDGAAEAEALVKEEQHADRVDQAAGGEQQQAGRADAADQGLDRAKYNLGVAYFNGWGVPKDYIEAYAWWNLAAISDGTAPMTPAKRWRDDLERRLPPQAQLLAQQRTKQLQQEIENQEIESLKKEDQKRREEMKKGA